MFTMETDRKKKGADTSVCVCVPLSKRLSHQQNKNLAEPRELLQAMWYLGHQGEESNTSGEDLDIKTSGNRPNSAAVPLGSG